MRLEFSRQIFGKNPKYQISTKSVLWESRCSMRADRQTDMTKLVVAFAILRTCLETETQTSNLTEERGNRGVEKTTEQRASCSVRLTKYHSGDEVKKTEMGRASSMYA
jgi:hypothetical protein